MFQSNTRSCNNQKCVLMFHVMSLHHAVDKIWKLHPSCRWEPAFSIHLVHGRLSCTGWKSRAVATPICRLAVDMKFLIHMHIHIHRFSVDIHGYIHIHRCLSCMHVSTLCLIKGPTFKLSVTLSNLSRFSKFLHYWKAYKIRYKTDTKLPTSP